MTAEAEQVLEQALTLPEEDRRAVAEVLLKSGGPVELDPRWYEEAEKARARVAAGQEQMLPVEDVQRRVRADLESRSRG